MKLYGKMINCLLTCLIKFESVTLMMVLKRFKHVSDYNYRKHALHIYTENEPARKRNDAVLNDFPGELYTIEAPDKIPDNCKYTLTTIQDAQNQKQTNTGGLAKLLKLKN